MVFQVSACLSWLLQSSFPPGPLIRPMFYASYCYFQLTIPQAIVQKRNFVFLFIVFKAQGDKKHLHVQLKEYCLL